MYLKKCPLAKHIMFNREHHSILSVSIGFDLAALYIWETTVRSDIIVINMPATRKENILVGE